MVYTCGPVGVKKVGVLDGWGVVSRTNADVGYKANEPAICYRRLECFFQLPEGLAFISGTYSLKQQMGCLLMNPTLSFRNLVL